MNDNRMKIFIDRDRMWGDTFAVRMGTRINDSVKWAIAEPVKFRVLEDEEMHQEKLPCFTLKKDEAQYFMDELWNAGFRPTEGSGSAGQLAAVQAHLKDMQRLVFTDGERAAKS